MVLILSVFMSSLMGSIHCVGMCGGFNLWAHQIKGENTYHLGRLIGYLVLGLFAGVLGEAISTLIPPVYQIIIGITLGSMILWHGIRIFLRTPSNQTIPSIIKRVTVDLLPKILNKSKEIPSAQGLILGLSSIFLPCGWLYSFLMVAAATGSVWGGVSVMISFWTGTIPALVLSAHLWATATGPIKRYSSQIQAVLLITVGLVTIISKLQYVTINHTSNNPLLIQCHAPKGPG